MGRSARRAALTSQIRGADIHVLDDADHLPNVEAAPQFNELLLELISRLN
jgi:pimeloyl-ACP methyl ester carboxylesterase